jgi:hypothetical protein
MTEAKALRGPDGDGAILERLAVIEAIVVRLEDRLFGNGQPGEIGLLKQRVAKLETWFWRAAGGVGILFALLELASRRIPQALVR